MKIKRTKNNKNKGLGEQATSGKNHQAEHNDECINTTDWYRSTLQVTELYNIGADKFN